jgi:hypothetical protein
MVSLHTAMVVSVAEQGLQSHKTIETMTGTAAESV